MEQKGYKEEILIHMSKSPGHIREMAKILNTNHMQILRRLNELAKGNVVDYKISGRNKIYFLKNTLESKNAIKITEFYKLTRALEKYPILRKIAKYVQSKKDIDLAIVFGSYAKNLAGSKSDIDVYVETTDNNIVKEISLIDSKINVVVGKYNKDSPLIKEIEKNYIILKGVDEFYEKRDIFEATI